ncbi:hypothetical protein [Hyphomonas sp.]|uniref:hypothetical protein n=1 Tax=Hyphomonas sp. TaxID=87 RepID=UPI00391A09CB
MRLLDYLIGGFALLTLPVLVWWGIYQSPQSAVNLEARLENAARAALSGPDVAWAEVRMNGQTAVLSGNAPSEDAVQEAAARILRSSGPGGLILGGVTQVERRTSAAPPVSPFVWQAEKTGEGLIILSGHVPSQAIRRRLVEEVRLAARSAVEDQMVLAAGAPEGNFQGVARLAISNLAKLETGRAEIRDHRLRLEGETRDAAVRKGVVSAISSVAAPFRGEPLLGGGGDWRARHEGGALVLSGRIPGEAERRQILAIARQGAGGNVLDAMETGSAPDPALLAGIAAGLAHFAGFTSGEMVYDRALGRFVFTGEAPASRLFFLREDLARSPLRQRSIIAAEGPGDGGALVAVAAFEAAGAATPCERAAGAVLAAGPLSFAPGTARIARESAAALDALAAAGAACPAGTHFELAAAGSGAQQGLDLARQAALSEFMAEAGFAAHRLEVITSAAGGPDGRVTDLRIKHRSPE